VKATRARALEPDFSRFDAGYYERYYVDETTKVAEDEYFDRLGAFIAAYVNFLGIGVARVLDIGCGIGLLREPVTRHFPRAHFAGVEASAYACERYGWTQGSIVDFNAAAPFDLVICHDVLQYLSHRDADKALTNLGRLCSGVLFFSVLTKEDWEHNCDQTRTDGDVFLRTTRWYRKRLSAHFHNAGGGVFVNRRADVILYSLDSLD
jgi:2-polyprenyl-3-methyl-5-hydroxy-6-metoxy-1,4-benzoquinol methylase